MSEFTKGPWVIDFDDKGGNKYGIVVTSDMVHADICQKITSDANARLIAAAPDLLEDLNSARATLANMKGDDTAGAIERLINAADAAIAKAHP